MGTVSGAILQDKKFKQWKLLEDELLDSLKILIPLTEEPETSFIKVFPKSQERLVCCSPGGPKESDWMNELETEDSSFTRHVHHYHLSHLCIH